MLLQVYFLELECLSQIVNDYAYSIFSIECACHAIRQQIRLHANLHVLFVASTCLLLLQLGQPKNVIVSIYLESIRSQKMLGNSVFGYSITLLAW